MPPPSQYTPTRPLGAAQPVVDLLLAIVAPIPVIARGWRTMRLGYAYLVHVFGVGLWFVLFTFYELFANAQNGWGGEVFVSDVLDELASADQDELLLMLLGIAATAVMIESGFLVLAWVLMPWGASPEPWRRSMNRGLSRIYQLTPFYAVSMVLLIACITWIDRAGGYYSYRTDRYQSGISWETQQLLSAISWLVYVVSQLGVTLWAMTIHYDRPRWAACCPWPAECEGCGYPLMGMDMARAPSCPECGMPVAESTRSPRTRPDRRSVFEKMLQATLRPYAFGKTLPLHRPEGDYRKALGIGAAMLVLTAPIGMALTWLIVALATGDFDDFIQADNLVSFLSSILIVCTIILPGSLFVGLFGATVWGAYARVFRGRYALYPAAQTFAYQSGFFTVWAMGLFLLIGIIIAVFESQRSGRYYSSRPIWIEFLPILIPAFCVVMAGTGFVLQGLLLRGARHGNG